MTQLNTNQFSQVPVKGQLDLQISRSGVISGQISENQEDPLEAGAPVMLDPDNTSDIPKFLAALKTEVAIGFLSFSVKQSTFSAGDACEVAGDFGPVMYLEAGDTIEPGMRVEQDDADGRIVPFTSQKVRGIALDSAVDGGIFRVIISTPVTALA